MEDGKGTFRWKDYAHRANRVAISNHRLIVMKDGKGTFRRKDYAHRANRVAISNHRLIAMEDGKGTFRWKDYAHRAKKRKMIVAAKEFIRRFLAVEEEPLVE
jgi:hypothetical protein